MRKTLTRLLAISALLAGFGVGAVHGVATVAADPGYPQDGGVGPSTTGSGFTATADDISVPMKTSVEVSGSLTYQNGAALTGHGQANDQLDWHGTIAGHSVRANWKVKLSGKLTAKVEILTNVAGGPSETYSASAYVRLQRHCADLQPANLVTIDLTTTASIAPESWGPIQYWVEFKSPPTSSGEKKNKSSSGDFTLPSDRSLSDATLEFYYHLGATGDITTQRPEKEVKSKAWTETPIACVVEGYDGNTLIKASIAQDWITVE